MGKKSLASEKEVPISVEFLPSSHEKIAASNAEVLGIRTEKTRLLAVTAKLSTN